MNLYLFALLSRVLYNIVQLKEIYIFYLFIYLLLSLLQALSQLRLSGDGSHNLRLTKEEVIQLFKYLSRNSCVEVLEIRQDKQLA